MGTGGVVPGVVSFPEEEDSAFENFLEFGLELSLTVGGAVVGGIASGGNPYAIQAGAHLGNKLATEIHGEEAKIPGGLVSLGSMAYATTADFDALDAKTAKGAGDIAKKGMVGGASAAVDAKYGPVAARQAIPARQAVAATGQAPGPTQEPFEAALQNLTVEGDLDMDPGAMRGTTGRPYTASQMQDLGNRALGDMTQEEVERDLWRYDRLMSAGEGFSRDPEMVPMETIPVGPAMGAPVQQYGAPSYYPGTQIPRESAPTYGLGATNENLLNLMQPAILPGGGTFQPTGLGGLPGTYTEQTSVPLDMFSEDNFMSAYNQLYGPK